MRYCLILIICLLLIAPVVSAQQPGCGLVDAIDYPIDGLVPGYDDFGLHRERFGGNHTGVDIGFDRWGDPVYAAARGQVTYSDPEGWGTEKGVVVLKHSFPDGSIAYGVYGHMEESDTIVFPNVGDCVKRGNVVGTIGWPSQGRPHLHYELRSILPFEGGPGYVNDNPLDDGWYNPLDFTALWRVRFTPAYVSSITFDQIPTLPPLELGNGVYVFASGDTLSAALTNQVLWRVKFDSPIAVLSSLSDGRIVALTHSGQVNVMQDGRYVTIWKPSSPAYATFELLGDKLIFASAEGGLAAYDAAGNALWTTPATAGGQLVYFAMNVGQIGLAVQNGTGVDWQWIDENGQTSAQIGLDAPPDATYPLAEGGWILLEGTEVVRLQNGTKAAVATLPEPPGSPAQISADGVGNITIYLGDGLREMISFDAAGKLRWRADIPPDNVPGTPLLSAGTSCLYTLNADGMLNVWQAADGKQINQLQLYAGGNRTRFEGVHLLQLDDAGYLQVEPGFITLLTLDASRLGGTTEC